jgi:hypothetical protein
MFVERAKMVDENFANTIMEK